MKIDKNKPIEIKKDERSPWIDRARERRQNRGWKEKSFKIAARVLKTLEDKGMTQKELAAQMEVSPQFVNRIASGKENLTLKTISKLETILGISLAEVPKYYTKMKTTPQEPIKEDSYISNTKGYKRNTKLETTIEDEWDDNEPDIKSAA